MTYISSMYSAGENTHIAIISLDTMFLYITILSPKKLFMANSSIPSADYWCISWTKPVYLYGLVIPGIALFIFGLTFNPIALYYFATSRNFRRSVYAYYFSAIAVVDLIRLTIWFCFLLLDYKILKLHFHPSECSIQTFLESVASSISVWLTVSLTIERCLVIYKPLQTLTDTRGRRALIVILCVILASCAVNSLVLQPGFYTKRVYMEELRTIICYYYKFSTKNQTETNDTSILTPDRKRIYLLFIVIIRVAIPFMLIFTGNILLFISVRATQRRSVRSQPTLLVRHGHHRQITPMIFFSSCILLLTISPRYLHQFYVNYLLDSINCSLIHIAPHLLRTFELFNYSFNVFISIVSGKHGRHELFNMLLCRTKTFKSKFYSPSTHHSSVFVKTQYQQRLNHQINEKINANHRLLLSNNYS